MRKETIEAASRLTTWLSVGGLTLALVRRNVSAGVALCTAGFGGLGVLWERRAHADLRHARDLKALSRGEIDSAIFHAALAAFGVIALRREA